jgi:hypothetical protein
MEIEVHIEELVLHGFPPGDRHRLGEALERELSRLLHEEWITGPMSEGAEVRMLDAGAFQVPPAARAESVGALVAQSVHRGLTR